MKTKKYKLEKLREIPIMDIVEKLELEGCSNPELFRCPREENHTNGDARASLKVYKETNTFWCYPCGEGGSTVDLVMFSEQVDFKEACHILQVLFIDLGRAQNG